MGFNWGYVVASVPGLVLLLLYGISPATADLWAPRVAGALLLALAGLAGVAALAALAAWTSPKDRG